MFYFIIPRTPVESRSPLREALWTLTLKSLTAQTSGNWHALVIGHPGDVLPEKRFTLIPRDLMPKLEKVKLGLSHLEKVGASEDDYLIRLDDDDLVEPVALRTIESDGLEYDCCYDEFHTYVDVAYMRISQRRNSWLPNTVAHRYRHALQKFKSTEPLIAQDHDLNWREYYKGMNVKVFGKQQPFYYRLLSPGTITAQYSGDGWRSHMRYLQGYGPWKTFGRNRPFYAELLQVNRRFFSTRPGLTLKQLVWNGLRSFRSRLLS